MSARVGLAGVAATLLVVGVGAGAGCKDVLGFGHVDPLADGSVGQVCDKDTPCGVGATCIDGLCQANAGGSSSGSSDGGSSSGSAGGSSGSGSGSGGGSGGGSGSGSGGDGGGSGETLVTMQSHPNGIAVIPGSPPNLVWTNGGSPGQIGYCALPACSTHGLLTMNTMQPPGQIVASRQTAYWVEGDGIYDCDPPSGCNANGFALAYGWTGAGPIAVDPMSATWDVYFANGGNVSRCPGEGATCSPTSIIAIDAGPIVDMTVSPGSDWVLVADGDGVHGCATNTTCTVTENTVMALSRGATKVAADAYNVYAAVGTTLPDGGGSANVIAMCPAPPSGCPTTDNYTSLYSPPKGVNVTALAANSGKIYWALRNGGVYSCTPSAGGCQGTTQLFTAQSSPPSYFAFDATYLYFTDDAAGTVGRVPK
ncbi:MAG TPA: hypothetical protein VF765_33430 [Polyangiaceae bacterium]